MTVLESTDLDFFVSKLLAQSSVSESCCMVGVGLCGVKMGRESVKEPLMLEQVEAV